MALLATSGESEERRREAVTGRLLTRAFLALALRAPLASQSAPSGLVFGYFILAAHKFAWSEFEQPSAGPQGENHEWFS
jgi:hypothetical protein